MKRPIVFPFFIRQSWLVCSKTTSSKVSVTIKPIPLLFSLFTSSKKVISSVVFRMLVILESTISLQSRVYALSSSMVMLSRLVSWGMGLFMGISILKCSKSVWVFFLYRPDLRKISSEWKRKIFSYIFICFISFDDSVIVKMFFLTGSSLLLLSMTSSLMYILP